MGLMVYMVFFGVNAWSMGVVLGADGRTNWYALVGLVVSLGLIRYELVTNYARYEGEE